MKRVSVSQQYRGLPGSGSSGIYSGKKGKVFLVGAGPGDPELMTIKAVRMLQVADTVIYDRLIPTEVLSWCRSEACLIDVGKYPDHHRVSQSQINELLVRHAQRGECVVRLKGGDPFVFGRGQEEKEYCRKFGVECLVIPGISSCIAAPLAMGIPVTTRGMARSFTVLTGQTDPLLDHQLNFAALAQSDTLVILMGLKNLSAIARGLIEGGKPAETPAAAIQDATLPDQRIVVGSLAELPGEVQRAGLRSPMVAIVGEVARFCDCESYCRELMQDIQSQSLV